MKNHHAAQVAQFAVFGAVLFAACQKEDRAPPPFDKNADEAAGHLTKAQGGQVGDSDYCNDPTAPCTAHPNEGDCDFDWQCGGGTDPVCGTNNGLRFGAVSNADFCWERHCENGVLDGDESDVDCGGNCGTCPPVQDAGVPPDSGEPPDSGIDPACICPTSEAAIHDTWAGNASDYWAVGFRNDGQAAVYHFDGTTWVRHTEDPAQLPYLNGTNLDLYAVAGRVTGPSSSAVFAIGSTASGSETLNGSGIFENGLASWTWEDRFVYSGCTPSDDIWVSQDGTFTILTGQLSFASFTSSSWDVICNDPAYRSRIMIEPEDDHPSDYVWITGCEADETITVTNFASWDPNSVAYQVEVRAHCTGVWADCDPSYPDGCNHEYWPLDANEDYVEGWSGGNKVPLHGARLVGVPCGSLTGYAQVGSDLYAFDELLQQWVPANADWPLVQSTPTCRTSYPELPMPACSCP